MNFLSKRKKSLIFIGTIAVVLFSSNHLFAYDETIVHPSLTAEIAKLYNLNYGDKLTEQEINWIKQGSIDEDKIWGGIKQIRSSNHFYNPFGTKEWKDYNLSEKIPSYFSSGIGLTSKIWAHDSVAQSQYVGGDYTWERAIYDYIKGDKKHAYESLGHILHLIEDKTVPAHTRNDFHLSPKELEAYQSWLVIRNFVDYEPYETWTGNQAKSGGLKFNFSDSLFQQNKKPIILSNLDAYFDNVAGYANTKFFSKDTIYVYSMPNNNAFEGSEKLTNGKVIDYVYGLDENGQRIRLAKISYDDPKIPKIYTLLNINKEIETNIYSDYWSRLAPKSILAGAGIIKLFKDETEKTKTNPAAIQKPDTFATYYFIKPAIQTASAMNSAIVATASSVVSGLNQIKNKISYSLAPPASSKYTLVFDMSQAIPASSVIFFGNVAQIQTAKAIASVQPQTAQEAVYSAALISQPEPEIIIEPNKEINLSAQFKNSGIAIWQQNKIFLNVYLQTENISQFYHSSWLTTVRPAKLTEPQVNPDSFGNFNFLIKSPLFAGDYFFKVRPVWQDDAGNFNWLSDDIVSWHIKVKLVDIAQTENNTQDKKSENIVDISQSKAQDANMNAKNNIKEENQETPSQEEDKNTVEDNKTENNEAIDSKNGQDNANNTEIIASAAPPTSPPPFTPFFRSIRDITPPETGIIEKPAAKTSANTASFKFYSSEDHSTFLCSLDNSNFVSCGANKIYENLADGGHNLKVKAVDLSGNSDETPAEFSWTIDSAPPAKITNLASVAGDTRGKINLSWTKPEENISYEIRYGEKEIVEIGATDSQTNWQDAGQILENIDNNAEQIEIGSATTLSPGQTYYFAIKSKDELNNVSEISNLSSSAANAGVNHIVISEIAVGVDGASNEFIEIYNPTDFSLGITEQIGLKIKLVDSSGNYTEKVITWVNNTINSHGYFLIGHGSLGSINIDATYGGELLTGVSGVILLDKDNQVIDKVSWGEKPPKEKLPPLIASEGQGIEIDQNGGLLTGQSIERKANYSSTAESMSIGADKYLGNGWDSDNNSQDFVLRTISDPQNSQSAAEPIYAPEKIKDFSIVALSGNSHTIKLTWTAPYGNFGNPEKLFYDIRYSTNELTAQNFNSTDSVFGITPLMRLTFIPVKAAGEAQELIIEGLSLGKTYYFAIKTMDITRNIDRPESEISFTSYTFLAPNIQVFLQNLGKSYFGPSTNSGSDGLWPQVSQTIGNGFDQRLVKATASVKCNSDSSCNVSYKSFSAGGYLDAGYTQIAQGSGFFATGEFGNDPSLISANSAAEVNFSGWPSFMSILNPAYYYKITFQLNTNSPIQWGGSSLDSYANGSSTDYSGGADLYFKLLME